jgi:lipoprotein-anchoring transpeptidase ErfK/SrfK
MRSRGTSPTAARRTSRLVGAAAIAAALGLLAACGGNSAPAGAAGGSGSGSTPPAVPAAALQLTPAAGAVVDPTTPVTVKATSGKIQEVTVTAGDGSVVPGVLNPDGTWSSTSPLPLAATLAVAATGVNSTGKVSQFTSAFTTVTPTTTVKPWSISPLNNETVGVAMPIVVKFSSPVTDRAAVEARLTVATTKPVVGSWYWVSDSEVHYRPQTYWPAGTDVTLHADLNGVKTGDGAWGVQDRTIVFHVGAAVVSTVDVTAHTLTVTKDGALLKTIPITTGKQGYLTRNGTKVVMSKEKTRTMDSTTVDIPASSPDHYHITVQYAMRLTNSGEFLHAAPWSTGSQGESNVSHGCTGMSTDNAAWLFDLLTRGDPVTYVNSNRALEPGNGWTDWNVSTDNWLKGSALATPTQVTSTVAAAAPAA